MPISVSSPIVQPCSITLWPTVTSRPMVSGEPASVCSTLRSWTLEFSPTVIGSLSPRSTAPNQTLAPGFRITLPRTVAPGAIQYSPCAGRVGAAPPRL